MSLVSASRYLSWLRWCLAGEETSFTKLVLCSKSDTKQLNFVSFAKAVNTWLLRFTHPGWTLWPTQFATHDKILHLGPILQQEVLLAEGVEQWKTNLKNCASWKERHVRFVGLVHFCLVWRKKICIISNYFLSPGPLSLTKLWNKYGLIKSQFVCKKQK